MTKYRWYIGTIALFPIGKAYKVLGLFRMNLELFVPGGVARRVYLCSKIDHYIA
jgi:hypothetical protein